jgi:hypothetical protein
MPHAFNQSEHPFGQCGHFSQVKPFDVISCNEHQEHESQNGSIISYQLLFTKPRASNVFDHIVTRLPILYNLTNYMYYA